MFVFQGAQPYSALYSPSVWRRRSWQCADTHPARISPLVLWPWCHRKRSWMTRKFRWLPQVCERDNFSASEHCLGFGVIPGIPTQTCWTRVSRSGTWEMCIYKIAQVNLMNSQVRLSNMVVQCTACTTVQGSSAARVENWLHRDCLQVTGISSWGLTADTFFTKNHCLVPL